MKITLDFTEYPDLLKTLEIVSKEKYRTKEEMIMKLLYDSLNRTFNVRIINVTPHRLIPVIKFVKDITNYGLKESKELVERCGILGVTVLTNIDKDELNKIKEKYNSTFGNEKFCELEIIRSISGELVLL